VDTEADIARVAQYLKEMQTNSSLSDSLSSFSSSSSSSSSTSSHTSSIRFASTSSASSTSSAALSEASASLTQTVSYSKALALLDWDWKRQLKAAQMAEDTQYIGEKIGKTPMTSSNSVNFDHEERLAESTGVQSPLNTGSWGGGVLPPLPKNESDVSEETAATNSAAPYGNEPEMSIERIEEMISKVSTDVLIRDLLFGHGKVNQEEGEGAGSNSKLPYPLTAYASVATVIVNRCVSESGRSNLLQSLNECRTGEVAVPNIEGRFDAVVSVFAGCLGICDEQRDVKHAKQFMIMSETIYSDLKPPLYVQARVCDHDLWSRRWFWEDVLLSGVTEQFDLSPQEVPWEDLSPEQLHDEVLRVHNTVFAQLGAIVSNMVRFGRSSSDIRKFLSKMCARSQLSEDMCLQLNKMLEDALNSPTRRTSALPTLPDSTQSLSFQHPSVTRATLEDMDDEDDVASETSSISSQSSSPAPTHGKLPSSQGASGSGSGGGGGGGSGGDKQGGSTRRRSGGEDFLGIYSRQAISEVGSESGSERMDNLSVSSETSTDKLEVESVDTEGGGSSSVQQELLADDE
jgi:hypothetical protein